MQQEVTNENCRIKLGSCRVVLNFCGSDLRRLRFVWFNTLGKLSIYAVQKFAPIQLDMNPQREHEKYWQLY